MLIHPGCLDVLEVPDVLAVLPSLPRVRDHLAFYLQAHRPDQAVFQIRYSLCTLLECPPLLASPVVARLSVHLPLLLNGPCPAHGSRGVFAQNISPALIVLSFSMSHLCTHVCLDGHI